MVPARGHAPDTIDDRACENQRMNLNDELANDRTFLAWLRTGIALFGLGFVVAKVAYLITSDPQGLSDRDLYTIMGVLIVACGAAIVLVGFWQHRAVIQSIRRTDDASQPRWPLTISLVAAAGALLLTILIVASS
jgi:putative membrane protein